MQFGLRITAWVAGFFLAASVSAMAQNAPLTFQNAIELALKNSATSGIAQADLDRARAGFRRTRDLFAPQVTAGSGLAFSYGFPLSLEGSAPSIFNVNTQEFLINFAQRQYVKAAKTEIGATEAQNADRRNDVIMETAIDYIQLDRLQGAITAQQEQAQFAARFEEIVKQRVDAGLDATVELTRAHLAAARTRMEAADTKAAVDQLRLRLSQLTGLPQSAIQTSTATIPAMPAISQEQDMAGSAIEHNSAVKIAEQAALTKSFRAKGDEKQFYPAIDLVAQYSMLARYNNYDEFFRKFQRNNVTLGVAIRFPFFNPSQKAAAQMAEADAVKARKEAQNVKEQVSNETLRLQRLVERLAAARDVSQLEHQIAQADVDAAQEKIQAGGATLKDEQNARIAEHQRYTAFVNSSFELEKAEIQLLRQTGELEGWALGSKH